MNVDMGSYEFGFPVFSIFFAAFFCLIPIGFVGLVIFLIIRSRAFADKRVASIREYSSMMGFTLDETRDIGHAERYRQFSIFQFGSNQYAWNTMTKTLDLGGHSVDIVMGDYHYETSSSSSKGSESSSTRLSYLIAKLPWKGAPETIVRAENIFDRVSSFIGFDDIDFESDEFSRRFMVRSKDRKFAYDLIDARMMEYLLGSNPPMWDMQGDSICLTRGVLFMDAGGFDDSVRWLAGFLENIPDHVIRKLEEGGS